MTVRRRILDIAAGCLPLLGGVAAVRLLSVPIMSVLDWVAVFMTGLILTSLVMDSLLNVWRSIRRQRLIFRIAQRNAAIAARRRTTDL